MMAHLNANRSIDRLAIFFLPLVLVGISVLYYHVFVDLIHDWRVSDDYSHGFFIPIISCYLIYGMKNELKAMAVKPANWGLIIIAIGLCQLYLASVGSEYFLKRTSLVPVLIGSSLFLLGTQVTKRVLLPIAYLFFMVPIPAIIWNKIAFPMQLFSSAMTEKIVRLVGIPIFREGNVLHLANTTLEVVNACSGLRSLMTMFALSAALAMLSSFNTGRKWILLFTAAPIAVIANITRLTGTAILASIYGPDVAHGFLHDFSGIVVFVMGLAMLIGVNSLLNKTGG